MSNKTLKVNAKKTKSAPKTKLLKDKGGVRGLGSLAKKNEGNHLIFAQKVLLGLSLSLALLMAAASVVVFYDYVYRSDNNYSKNYSKDKVACLELGENQCLDLEVVQTKEEITKGLSGREILAKDKGMLFKFSEPSELCFWMKDMKFDIDIIWLDSEKRITKIERNLTPATYPKTYCSEDSKYVIEINSGLAGWYGLGIGQRLSF